jgi:hypothetical protein
VSEIENKPKRGNPNWVKGAGSPNPSGRPKGYSAFRRAFRKLDDVQAIRAKLLALIHGDDNNAALAAAKLWLEYGYGKTPAAPEDNDALRESGRPLAGKTGDEILAALRAKGETP